MNKNYLYVLPLALAMVAFSSQSVAQERNPECKGDPQAPTITLNLKSKTAKPECALAHLGSTIVFSVVPKKGLDKIEVAITPKHALDSWLQGDNSDLRDIIIVRVPGEYDPDNVKGESSQHKYNIIIDGEVIDPRIEVQH